MRLAILAIVVAVGLGAGDVAARNLAETQLATLVGDRVPGDGATSATIESFPFVGQLLVQGRVPRVQVSQEGVPAGPLVFNSISVDLRDVRIDRAELVERRRVSIIAIDRGLVTAVLGEGQLSAATGVTVHLGAGTATANVAGREVTVEPSLTDGVLHLGPLSVTIPEAPMLPCATDVRIEPRRALITCTIDEVPAELLRQVAEQAGRLGG